MVNNETERCKVPAAACEWDDDNNEIRSTLALMRVEREKDQTEERKKHKLRSLNTEINSLNGGGLQGWWKDKWEVFINSLWFFL